MPTEEEYENQLAGLKARASAADDKRRAAETALAEALEQVKAKDSEIAATSKKLSQAEKNAAALEALTGKASEWEAQVKDMTAKLAEAEALRQRDLLMADNHGLGAEARDYMAFQFSKQTEVQDFGKWLDGQKDSPIYKAFTGKQAQPPAETKAPELKQTEKPPAVPPASGTDPSQVAALLSSLGFKPPPGIDPSRGALPAATPPNGEPKGVDGLIKEKGRTAAFEHLFGAKPAINLD